MEGNSIVFRHWDDVVFENRNKNYGAYLLRRAYANRLMAGVVVTIAMVAFILSLQNFYAGRHTGPEVQPPPFEKTIRLAQPLPIERTGKPVNSMREPKSNVQNQRVIVTTDEVTETEIETSTEYISDEGTGSGETGILEGAGTLSIPEPVVEDRVKDFAEVMPQYEGGLEAMMKFIQKKIRYPRAPRVMGIEGTVFIRFVINSDGSVSGVEVIKGVHPDYDKEAMRVISMMPSWRSGSQNGQPVAVRMVLPIKFNLKN